MKALLLAAGLGSRLRPLTNTIPKCLVPIQGKPLLAYWLDLLSGAGITHFYINLYYHAAAVREFIASSPHREKVTLLEEPHLLGTGGTLKKNADLFLEDDFFLAHADNLCLTDFSAFIAAHNNRPDDAAVTMMTFTPPDPTTCGVVELDDKGLVTGFFEKVENPPTDLANGAVFVMTPEVAAYAKTIKKDKFEISLDIIPHFVGRVFTWHNADYHLDIGTPQTYEQAQSDVLTVQRLYDIFQKNTR